MWKHKTTIIVTIVVFAAVAYGLSLLQETLYQAEGTVVLVDPRTAPKVSDLAGFSRDPKRHVANQAELIVAPRITDRAAQILGGSPNSEEISHALSAEPVEDRDALNLEAAAPTAAQTVAILDAVVEAYEEIVTAGIQASVDPALAALEQERTELEAKIADLDRQIATGNSSSLNAQLQSALVELRTVNTSITALTAQTAAYGSGMQVYITPETPTTPSQPQPLRNGVLAAILGVVIGVTIAWWRGEGDLHSDREAPKDLGPHWDPEPDATPSEPSSL